MTKPLIQKLKEYSQTHIPMHMPGHKRNSTFLSADLPYDIDITEIDGFDNLHDMQGVLKETASFAAQLYGTKYCYPLVNGSTCGILSAMHALCPYGGHVLLQRDCHKSVYNGVGLLGLTPHYLVPEQDEHGISQKMQPEQVEKMLQAHSDISLVVLTSPTYEGTVQSIKEIAEICHNHEAYLLVDSAHGAHFGFSKEFPQSAVTSGADIVVMSLHKTMPCLTQTALLHICTEPIDASRVAESLSIFETSSPSYVLLASIDECLRLIAEKKDALFSTYNEHLSAFYKNTQSLKHLSVFHTDDPGKIIISTRNTNLSGADLAKILRKTYAIETEMSAKYYVLAMTSVCDDGLAFQTLSNALSSIDANCTDAIQEKEICTFSLPKQLIIPSEAKNRKGTFCDLFDAVGKVALESVWAYPPGIPYIVPGEEIPKEFPKMIQTLKEAGVELKSTKGKIKENAIYVI